MISDDIGQLLHDRASRGQPLSSEEQTQLQEWYARHDQEEIALLGGEVPARDLAELEAQEQQVAADLVEAAQCIQFLTAENAKLRREIAILEKRLSEKVAGTSLRRG